MSTPIETRTGTEYFLAVSVTVFVDIKKRKVFIHKGFKTLFDFPFRIKNKALRVRALFFALFKPIAQSKMLTTKIQIFCVI